MLRKVNISAFDNTFALVITLSGLFMGLGWVSKSIYWIASGGQSMPAYYQPSSDTTLTASATTFSALDQIWHKAVHELADNKSTAMIIGVPDSKDESVYVYTNTEGPRYQVHYFDQVSAALLKGTGVDVTRYSEANGGDNLLYSFFGGSKFTRYRLLCLVGKAEEETHKTTTTYNSNNRSVVL